MASRITWANKVLSKVLNVPVINKMRDVDINQIKSVVNDHADDIEALQDAENIAIRSFKPIGNTTTVSGRISVENQNTFSYVDTSGGNVVFSLETIDADQLDGGEEFLYLNLAATGNFSFVAGGGQQLRTATPNSFTENQVATLKYLGSNTWVVY